jgi:AraC family transcriptional regulator
MTEFHTHPHFESSVLRIEEFQCPDGTIREAEEQAACHEIALVRSGMFVRRDASGYVTGDANHVLFFQRHQPYHIQHPAGGGDRCTVFVLSDAALLDMLRGWSPATADNPERPFPVSHTPVTPRQRLAHYHLLALADSYADPLHLEESVLLFLGDIVRTALAHAGNTNRAARPITNTARREIVHQVKSLLAVHYAEALHIDDMAQAVHSSAYWLCRIFRAETGISLHQYLLRLRLGHALEILLECPHDSLTDIALGLGFYSHSHFTTTFSREFGIAPSEFRKRRRMSRILEA